MTTRRRQIDEFELDALLRALMVEGVDDAPQRIAGEAMTAVARTRQSRAPLVTLRSDRRANLLRLPRSRSRSQSGHSLAAR